MLGKGSAVALSNWITECSTELLVQQSLRATYLRK